MWSVSKSVFYRITELVTNCIEEIKTTQKISRGGIHERNIVSATSCFTEGYTPPYLLLN